VKLEINAITSRQGQGLGLEGSLAKLFSQFPSSIQI